MCKASNVLVHGSVSCPAPQSALHFVYTFLSNDKTLDSTNNVRLQTAPTKYGKRSLSRSAELVEADSPPELAEEG